VVLCAVPNVLIVKKGFASGAPVENNNKVVPGWRRSSLGSSDFCKELRSRNHNKTKVARYAGMAEWLTRQLGDTALREAPAFCKAVEQT